MTRLTSGAIAFTAIFLLFLAAPLSAQTLYGSQGGAQGGDGGRLVILDTDDASATLVGTPFDSVGMPGIEFLQDGRLVAVSSVNHSEELDTSYLLELDPHTGALLSSQPLLDSDGNGCAFGDIAMHPGTGVLYGIAANQSSLGTRCGVGGSTGGYLATIDPATGIYTTVGRDAEFGNASGGIAFGPDGTLYFTAAWASDDTLYTLDPATADVLSTTDLTPGGSYFGLAWDPTENQLYGSYDWGPDAPILVTIEPASGSVTVIGDTDFNYMGIAFSRGVSAQPIAVPMGSYGFLGLLAFLLALAAMWSVRGRRSAT